MRVAVVDGPTTLKLLCELVPMASEGGIQIKVAWVRPNRLLPHLIKHARKVGGICFGNSFDRTDPDCIRQLIQAHVPCRLVSSSHRSVFHPKEYYLQGVNWRAALVGSSNLTAGGLGGFDHGGGNTEASMFYFNGIAEEKMKHTQSSLKHSNVNATFMVQEPSMLDEDLVTRGMQGARDLWDTGTAVDQAWINQYAKNYQATLKKQRADLEIKRQAHLQKLKKKHNGWLKKLSWQGLIEEFEKFPEDLSLRMTQLDVTHELLRSTHGRFSRLSEPDKMAIAGLSQHHPMVPDVNWLTFGNMKRNSAKYQQLLKHDLQWLKTVDKVFSKRVISHGQAQDFMTALAVDGVGLGRVSRLLAMLRPAEFLPVTGNNLTGLRHSLGIEGTVNMNHYFPRIIEPLHQSPWYQEPFNESWHSEMKIIWRYRMALVDMLVYSSH